jgi:hypothetical protein
MEEANGFLSNSVIAELDKRESAFSACFAVDWHEHVQHISRTGEMGSDFLFGRVVGKIPDK